MFITFGLNMIVVNVMIDESDNTDKKYLFLIRHIKDNPIPKPIHRQCLKYIYKKKQRVVQVKYLTTCLNLKLKRYNIQLTMIEAYIYWYILKMEKFTNESDDSIIQYIINHSKDDIDIEHKLDLVFNDDMIFNTYEIQLIVEYLFRFQK
jgi:hypothetical protein